MAKNRKIIKKTENLKRDFLAASQNDKNQISEKLFKKNWGNLKNLKNLKRNSRNEFENSENFSRKKLLKNFSNQILQPTQSGKIGKIRAKLHTKIKNILEKGSLQNKIAQNNGNFNERNFGKNDEKSSLSLSIKRAAKIGGNWGKSARMRAENLTENLR